MREREGGREEGEPERERGREGERGRVEIKKAAFIVKWIVLFTSTHMLIMCQPIRCFLHDIIHP